MAVLPGLQRLLAPLVMGWIVGCGSSPAPSPESAPAPPPPRVAGPDAAPDEQAAFDPKRWTWRPAGSLPTPRIYYALASNRQQAFVIGGRESLHGTPMNTVEAYDAATNAWRSLPPLQTPRAHAGALAFEGGHILVVGGLGEDGYVTAAELYDPSRETWTPLESPGRGRVQPLLAQKADGTVVLAGGSIDDGEPLPEVMQFDLTSRAWTSLPMMDPPRIPDALLPLADGSIVALGGYGFDGNTAVAPLRLADGAESWAELPAPTQRANGAYVAGTDWIVAVGGSRYERGRPARPVEAVERWSAATGRWEPLPPLSPTPRLFTASTMPDGTIVVVGGEPAGGGHDEETLSTLWALLKARPSSWISGPPLPAPRRNHHAVSFADGSVLVLGGWRGGLHGTELHDAIALVPG